MKTERCAVYARLRT